MTNITLAPSVRYCVADTPHTRGLSKSLGYSIIGLEYVRDGIMLNLPGWGQLHKELWLYSGDLETYEKEKEVKDE